MTAQPLVPIAKLFQNFWPLAAQSSELRALAREVDAILQSAQPLLFAVYYGALGILSLYALHRLHLLVLLSRPRKGAPVTLDGRVTAEGESEAATHPRILVLPRVTVQLPIFNERTVAQRLLDAVAQLDYPTHRLEIQVLDDSTDETSALLAARVADLQQLGHNVQHLRRTERTGYKAGALKAGLERASGELIAVFDADFLPHTDFLQRLVPHFEDPNVGMVQARWDHLNKDHSLLTRLQAILLDGHFLIEHAARSRAGRLFNFNGTAGVWRKTAISDGGGWQHDTLTEDLDLSYRSQLAGWQFKFLSSVGVPAELPESLAAYRGQQRRWTRGSAQTFRKLAGALFRSPLTIGQRTEAIAHLSANLGYPLTVLIALLLPLVVYLRHIGSEPSLLWLDLGLLASGTLSLCAFYLEATRRRGDNLLTTLILMPALLALCMGLAWHNAKAALGGLFIRGGEFERTPKRGCVDASNAATARYGANRRFPWGETLITLYLGCAVMFLASAGAFLGLPFLLLFLCGFSSAAATLWRRKGAVSSTQSADERSPQTSAPVATGSRR